MQSIEFAAHLQRRAIERGLHYNITKIQKWSYIAYGLYLVVTEGKEALFDDDRPYCWPYGPVFPNLYYKQKDDPRFFQKIEQGKEFSEFYTKLIDIVLDIFGKWSASELSSWTHEESKAWDKAYHKNPNISLKTILSSKDIYQDFKSYIQ